MILRPAWTRQPGGAPGLDTSNPLTRGLIACVVPVGASYLELVTMTLGARTGSLTPGAYAQQGGNSAPGTVARAIAATGTTTDQVVWPASLSRGGNLTTQGTILALAGTTEQVDGKLYVVGGNTETVTNGDGFSLFVDSFSLNGRGNVASGRYSGGTAASTAQLLGNPFDKRLHFFGYSWHGGGGAGNGTYFGARTAETGANIMSVGTVTSNRKLVVHTPSDGATGTAKNAYVAQMMIWDRELSLAEYQALYDNPWQVFAPPARRLWVPVAAAGGSHAATGALVAGVATIAGTALHPHTSTGALAASAATIAGAALHPHTSTGALVAGAAAVAGTAARFVTHTATGALAASAAVVAGAAARAAAGTHAATGAFVAGAAAITGTATHTLLHTSTGALIAGAAAIAGTATHNLLHTATGALVAGSATIVGAASKPSLHTSSGALVAGSALLQGFSAGTGQASPIFAPTAGIFNEWRGEAKQRPTTRKALDDWLRLLRSVRPTRID